MNIKFLAVHSMILLAKLCLQYVVDWQNYYWKDSYLNQNHDARGSPGHLFKFHRKMARTSRKGISHPRYITTAPGRQTLQPGINYTQFLFYALMALLTKWEYNKNHIPIRSMVSA
jgi:hypothetical protein